MKKIIKIILIIASFLILFVLLNILLTPKYSTNLVEGGMIREYYNATKDHEVIFIGDCEVYANISPMVLYEQEGIKAYVRGSSQQLLWQSYSILEETLKYETPKVVVLNVNAMRYDKPVSEAYNRLTIDYMKWSKQKIEIINSSMTEEENIFYYLFPILRYHDRFDKLTKEDFEYFINKKQNTHNGFLINNSVKPYTTLPTKKKLSNYEFSKIDYEYLDKILELCNKNNITLVLIKAPSLYPYWYEEYDEQIKDYASNHNLDYYNFIDKIDEIGIDFSKDTYDGGLHLNLDGATKLSNYFAPILKEKYNLTDYKNDKEYEELLKQYKDAISK